MLVDISDAYQRIWQEHGTLVARHGGEEFVALMVDVTTEQAIQHANALRQICSATRIRDERGVLAARHNQHRLIVYCADHHCSHWKKFRADPWPDQVRLSDLEPKFICKRCGKRGPDVRPDFDWDRLRGRARSDSVEGVFRLSDCATERTDSPRRPHPGTIEKGGTVGRSSVVGGLPERADRGNDMNPGERGKT